MKKLITWLKQPIPLDPEPITVEELKFYAKTKAAIGVLWLILIIYLLTA